MKRSVALSVGAAVALAAAVLLGPAARAGDEHEGPKRVEKRVVVRHAGGGGFLGVVLGDLEGEARGAKVRSVESGSPAEKAGIKEDDVVVRFDGEAVRSAGQLARLVRETPAGRSVPIEVTRDGVSQKLSATLGEGGRRMLGAGLPEPGDFRFELPEMPPPAHGEATPPAPRAHVWRFGPDAGPMFHLGPGQPRRLGVEFMDLSEQLAAYFKVEGAHGVLVTSVAADSPAAKAGVKAGDVILELDGHKIREGSDLRDAVADADKEVVLKIQREGRPLELKATLAKPEAMPHREAGITL